ncbi:MAG TPA: SIR2 family protein [Terriglobales bacterium]|jgi:hypothetical protein
MGRIQRQGGHRSKQQLAAIRFYLQTIIRKVELEWLNVHGGATNYATLLEDVEHWASQVGKSICLVTFNYDKMLEAALPRVGIICKTLNDYVAHDQWKLFKLHGSVDWVHRVGDTMLDFSQEWTNRRAIRDMIENIESQDIQEGIVINTSNSMLIRPNKNMAMKLFPAIAIPVAQKTGKD